MRYTLNEYYPHAHSTATRAEVYSDNITAANLLAYHMQNGAVELAVGECISTNELHLPMPDTLMQALDPKIAAANKRVIITGIDAYMLLLSKENIDVFMVALHKRIDAGKLNAAFLIGGNYFDGSVFSNEKYEDTLRVVYIGNTQQSLTLLTVSVIPEKWIRSDSNSTSWNALLKNLGKFEPPSGNYTLVLDNYSSKQPGLSDIVLQFLDVAHVAKKIYDIDENLPQSVLETLVAQCKDSNTTPIKLIKSKFGENNANIRLAVKRLLELRDDTMWPAYVWFLAKFIDSNSYLMKTLLTDVASDNLLRLYVCDTAITLLDDPNATSYANERAIALKEIDGTGDSLIIEFISKVKNSPSEAVACWLNCGTEAEHIEIIRRVGESDLTIGLPQIWHDLYPLLADYLSDSYDYGNSELTAYFRDYRRLKITDCISEDFVKRVSSLVLPSTIVSRDVVLQDLSADENVALLVVDGMGAEYLPLILGMAKRKALNVESATVAAAKLPTSTEINRIKWVQTRCLDPIHEIDTIAHNGAAKHESCAPSRNIEASLRVFERIMNCVASGLTQFERVVVTADHGSSRLAILAHAKGLSTTLQWDGEPPQDWRYAVAPPDATRPPGLESSYDVDTGKTYWVVRDYNRLPKKGPKLNELHDGGSLEERLVPVVVFSKAKVENQPQQRGKQLVEQLVERMDFDI